MERSPKIAIGITKTTADAVRCHQKHQPQKFWFRARDSYQPKYFDQDFLSANFL